MATNEIPLLEESVVKPRKATRRSIFDVKESEQSSNNTTLETTVSKASLEVDPMYPIEYIEKVTKECYQWKTLYKDTITEARHIKAHVEERKAVVLQDTSFLQEVKRLDALEAKFEDYLKRAQHFCNQQIIEQRINE
ncbi:unnamed protein product [Acanthoscelides obtectus]|uniref:Uncharacterized protein n=1 Tax=Acanthoscelides obtectus TaxID=200917 RepID=A0A9P0MHQ2_ACAOB|nr:unnamed protein product [Acanthoscelides obtectus]CAK1675448.1 hypothetical protein AOBTE_LOCUS30227 [Acanthoscelides obtectus]